MSYFDLNLPWPASLPQNVGTSSSSSSKKKQQTQSAAHDPAGPTGVDVLSTAGKQDAENMLKMLIHLGYATCAFNLIIPATTPFPAQTIKQFNPCFNFKPPFPELDTRSSKGKGRELDSSKILQLSRLTLTLDEATVKSGGGGITNSNAALFANYDLLSVLPLDSFAFAHACQSLITPSPISIDIITLDLASSPRLPFLLKRSLVLSAIKAGVAFEVVYAPTVASTGYSKEARRNVFAGVRELVRVTNGGRGLLISSSARQVMELRSPSDLTSLIELLGFKPEWAKQAVSGLPRNVIARGFSNRQTFRGTIKGPLVETVVHTGETSTAGASKKRPEPDAGAPADTAGSGPQPAEDDVAAGSKKRRRN